MELKKLDTLKKGEIKRFFQTYVDEKPEIFLFDECGGLHISREMIFELREKYAGQTIDYYGSGKVAKDKNDIFYMWNDKDTRFDKKHIQECSQFYKIKIEIR